MKRLFLLLIALTGLVGVQAVAAQDAPPAKIQLAVQDLSAQVGETITLDDLDSYQWSAQSFSDASLGCTKEGESYAQVVTPGYQFLLTYEGQTYDFRFPRQGDFGQFCGVTAVVEATETPISAPIEGSLTLEDVSFTVDSALNLGEMTASIVPAVAEGDDVPFWLPAPEHALFEFASDAAMPPQIIVYPVAEFEAMNIDLVNSEIDALRTLLETQPALDSKPPYLPLVNASLILWAQAKYLEFDGGSGIRYLTAFQQGPTPIANADLLYTFQGLTSDSQYYVSATFPVSASILDATVEPNAAFDSAVDIPETAQALNDLAPEGFTPNLAMLDNVILSLGIGQDTVPEVEATTITWEEARTFILNGEVASAFQAHSLEVRLTLKDGRQVTTTEPTIDAVFAVIEECGDVCADIALATE